MDGYSLRPLQATEDETWIKVYAAAVPTFTRADFVEWLNRYRSLALTDGILLVTDDSSGQPVATAGSIAHSKGDMFPRGGQLAWVATVPGHRKKGLGRWISAVATARLQRDGFRNIFLTTGDDLTPAISVYLALGYIPCLYADDQRQRWEDICRIINHPFRPERWPTPSEYVADALPDD